MNALDYPLCGCEYTVIDGTLYYRVESADAWVEVTAPYDQAALDAVNAHFGTQYTMKDFAGR